MSDKLVEITWKITAGIINGQYINAGDAQRVPADQARGYVANGYASYGKSAVGRAYEVDPELYAQHAKDVAAAAHNPEFDPKPGTQPIGRRPEFDRRRMVQEGWH